MCWFDSIPPRELLRRVARGVSDGRILALIKAWLRDPNTGRPTVTGNRRGTPQGGVISPLLANLYLNRLDWQVNDRCEQRPVLVRCADDFVILTRPGQGTELMVRVKRWLERNGLTLNETKTRLLDVREAGFKFLGFGVGWRRGKSGRSYPHMEPHPRSQTKLREKLREKLGPLDAVVCGGTKSSRKSTGCSKAGVDISTMPTARGCLTGSTSMRRCGCNAGCGASADAQKPSGRRTHGKFCGNATACIGCRRRRPGHKPGLRSDAREWPSENRMRENRPSGLMWVGVRSRTMTTTVSSPNSRTCLLFLPQIFQPRRYWCWMNSSASGQFVALSFAKSHSSFLPTRNATLPSSAVSVSGPE